MAGAAPAPAARRPGGSLTTFLTFGIILLILFNEGLRTMLGNAAGFVLEPAIGFDHRYPVLTILIAGTVMVVATTVVRHFTTDWLNMARSQAYMRHFNREMMAARKENNTYKMKKLQDKQPEVMEKQAEMSRKQMQTMPLTMIVVIPLFAWLFTFLSELDYWYFTAPWNPQVDMFTVNGILFGSSVFPHWILLYSALSIPVGTLIGRAMKYASWKERWQKRHPEVHEVHA